MTARAKRTARVLIVAGVIGALLQERMNAISQGGRQPIDWFLALFVVIGCVFMIAVGAVIVSRQPGNTIGWLLAGIGFLIEFWSFAQAYAPYALRAQPPLPFGRAIGFGSMWALPLIVSLFIPIFLLFPDGRPLSPRWRLAVWAWGIATAVSLVTFSLNRPLIAFGNGVCPPQPGDSNVCVTNPITSQMIRNVLGAISVTAGNVTALAAIAAVVSVVIRFRRAQGDERQQVKWIAFVGIAFFATFVPSVVLSDNVLSSAPEWVGTLTFIVFASVLVIGLPLAIAVAVLKYHLYDLDVVVRKTLIFGLLAAFIAGVYALVVGGIGALIGKQGNTGLSFVAAVVLALAFQPVRERARRFADRLVYGNRATPYEVLTEFAEQMSETYATDDVLPRMAQILAAGSGAERSTVWMLAGSEMREAASWPSGAESPVPPDDAVEVRHTGELLGALSVTMPAADPMTPAKHRLVEDLASQAGVVLRNVRLIDELRSSRQRLVAAQDEERRKIERNIHDGAQQQLVALSVQLKLARTMLDRDPVKTGELLDGLQTTASDALDDLRDLARGIYPPLLADKGLPIALEAQARRAAVPTTVNANGVMRYQQDVEAAVYFSCLEGLNNIAKYADASSATVALTQTDGHLTFVVSDDGRGFDSRATGYGTGLQGIADRLDAIGGTLSVTSHPGEGTTITGSVPARWPASSAPVPNDGAR